MFKSSEIKKSFVLAGVILLTIAAIRGPSMAEELSQQVTEDLQKWLSTVPSSQNIPSAAAPPSTKRKWHKPSVSEHTTNHKGLGTEDIPIVEKQNLVMLLNQRTWLSTGDSKWSMGGPGKVPDVISELIWNNLDSTVIEFNADFVVDDYYLLSLGGGFGGISGGTLRDLDFNGSGRTLLDSESLSTTDDDSLYYINLDFGYRLLAGNVREGITRNYVDLLLGYQHWKEKYIATKAVQLQDPNGSIGFTGPFPNQGKAITEAFTWDSLRIGGRSAFEVHPRVAIRVRGFYIPYTCIARN